MPNPIPWLLAGPPWVRYRALVDLLDRPEDDPEVHAARQEMLSCPQVVALQAELADWPGRPLLRHNDAAHPLHKLVFLADMGLRSTDPGMPPIVERILACRSAEGAFQIVANIHPRYGGSGQDERGWMLCDAPSILYALARFGLGEDSRVQGAAQHLAGLLQDNGWPCVVAPQFGRFRGPGRKGDPCPYATLLALKALAEFPGYRDGAACHVGAEALLGLWARRQEVRPYLFAMGSDFCKVKAPLIWYDILHVASTLRRFPWLRGDARLLEMAALIGSQADTEGCFVPRSVWKAWVEWDFGQKKVPSRWVTVLGYLFLITGDSSASK